MIWLIWTIVGLGFAVWASGGWRTLAADASRYPLNTALLVAAGPVFLFIFLLGSSIDRARTWVRNR